jgi:uncharacterized membrane protein
VSVAARNAAPQPRRLGRSVLAIVLGFLTVVVLSLATDQLLHVLEVYPPWGEPMFDTGLLALAFAYRTVYTVLGSYVAARMAPRNAMRHALILGAIGFVFATIGAVTAITKFAHLGPAWYPIALVVEAFPCAWLGGKFGVR